MSFGNFLENSLLNLSFGGETFTPSGTLYVALCSGLPNDDGTVVEPDNSTGYARATVTNTKDSWNSSTTGVVNNVVAVSFGTATSSWGYIDYFAVFDASGNSNGNMYGAGALTAAKTITTGDTPIFSSGSLRISLD